MIKHDSLAEETQAEPVASLRWMPEGRHEVMWYGKAPSGWVQVYTHQPAKQEPLTDDEVTMAVSLNPVFNELDQWEYTRAIEFACAKKWGVSLGSSSQD